MPLPVIAIPILRVTPDGSWYVRCGSGPLVQVTWAWLRAWSYIAHRGVLRGGLSAMLGRSSHGCGPDWRPGGLSTWRSGACGLFRFLL
jgi:hypothetical protein